MATVIIVSFSLFLFSITGWTITTYLVKDDSQKFIKEELKNLFDICKMFYVSLKSLIGILAQYSFSSDPSQTNTEEANGLDEQESNVFQLIETHSFEAPVMEDEDTALSAFSPELVEVITEEEEKVA